MFQCNLLLANPCGLLLYIWVSSPYHSATGNFLFSLLMALIWPTRGLLMFTSFPVFCSFTNPPRYHQAPHWSLRSAETVWVMDTRSHAGLWEHRTEMVQGFLPTAWIQLDLVGTHVRCGFLDGLSKFEITQTTSFTLCLSLWWIVMILQELSKEYDTGTGVHSQLTSRRVFGEKALALPWMEVVGLFPDPTWLWNMQLFMYVVLVLMSHVRLWLALYLWHR